MCSLYEIDQKMSRLIRFSSAAVGMVLLAGLAYYQGHPDPTAGQEGMLVGTAVEPDSSQPSQEQVENQSPECSQSDEPEKSDSGASEDCAGQDGSSG